MKSGEHEGPRVKGVTTPTGRTVNMKRSSIIVAVAAILATLVATTAAFASGPKDNTLYRYVGQFKGLNGTSVNVTVQNGNRAALRSLFEQKLDQSFATDEKTVVLRWKDGIPTKTDINGLELNDYVTVNVRSDRNADIGKITTKPAASIGDRGQTLNKPTKPLYLFRGTLVSVADGSSVTIIVKGGNRNALRLMIGSQSATQTFTTGKETVFLHWKNRVPNISVPTTWAAGDRIIVRIRADRGLGLADVLATPAKRVADREPRNHEAHQNDQS
jgi:hypothetical protein